MDRASAIRRSLAGFVCGIVGAIPVIGFIPALFAIASWRSVKRQYGEEWNPAWPYLTWGGRLAMFGVFATALIVFVVALTLLDAWLNKE
jgi:hypothetical protein